jgi:ketosteroid isomerase-like protein
MPRVILCIIVAAASLTRDGYAQNGASPQAIVDELLAADRAFSAASAKTDLISGLSAMLAADAIMPIPAGTFAEGKAAIIEALRANPDNAASTIEWTPVRGGISADGQHGFTFGYMKLVKADTSVTPLKYLSYWVKQPDGWRVAAYKRGRAPGGDPSPASMPPSLPPRIVAPSNDAAAVEKLRTSLADAERAFSRDAQTMGIGPAFARYGSDDAVNMGGPDKPGWVVGARAIGDVVGAGGPPTGSEVSWGPDKKVIVASSGDLGVSIGMIRRNTPPKDPKQPAAFPFFTVWRRATASAPWRYIAE